MPFEPPEYSMVYVEITNQDVRDLSAEVKNPPDALFWVSGSLLEFRRTIPSGPIRQTRLPPSPISPLSELRRRAVLRGPSG